MAKPLRAYSATSWPRPWSLLVTLLLLVPVACDDGPPPLDEAPSKKPTKGEANPEARAVAAKLTKKMTAKKATQAKVELSLTETDFVESTSNRDPFRSFLGMFSTTSAATVKLQRRVLLKSYSLDELKLIAIVSGNTRPVAMFIDPSKKGVTIKRGDYISKSEGRVKQILPDKVIIEIEEKADGRNSRTDRVIVLHEDTEKTDEEAQYDTLR